MSPRQYRFRASTLAALIAAGGAVGVAALGVVSQLVEQDKVTIDCGAYLKTLGDMAPNPDAVRLVTTRGPNGKPLLNFGKQADACGDPGPILEGLAGARSGTTTGTPTTTTVRP